MRQVLLFTFIVLALAACDSGADDPCPAGADESEADFLPLAAGDVWEFAYSGTTWMMIQPSIKEHGTLTLTLAEPVCSAKVRRVVASERRRGLRISSFTRGDGVTIQDTISFNEVHDIVLSENAEGIQLPWSSGIVARYHSATEDSVRVPAGPYGPVCGPGAAVATLTRNGLVVFEAACGHVSSSQSIKLVRKMQGDLMGY